MRQFLIFGIVAAVFGIFLLGCGGNGSDPIGGIPDTMIATSDSGSASGSANRTLWGLWQCSMEPGSGQIDIVPLRTATFTANVNSLLESKPGNLLIDDMDVSEFFTEGRLDCTITLKHPFTGLDMYHGFDVWGVFMHNENGSLDYDGLTYGADPDTGDNVAVLLNPDGWTRWFNYTEFSGSSVPILEFTPGELANIPNPTATLNPYKIFADDLGLNDSYYDWITTSGNDDNRGWFTAGTLNSRRYELEFPIIASNPVAEFQYAAIATWEEGDPALTGQLTVYDPGDFPTAANCEEAFFVHATTDDSDLYNDGAGSSGGTFRADIEVFDWQGGSVGGLGVPNEVESIIVEGDFVPTGSHEFSQVDLAGVAVSGTVNSSIFQVEIANCTPQASGEAALWVIVEAAGVNGDSFDQGFPTEYPDPARRASFLPGTVAISNESPLLYIYVDDSNTLGTEDGTQMHPYNTIQEGVDAAALLTGYEVWVDDSGNPYNEHVIMATDTILRSRNWDDSDGSNRAFIDGPDTPINTHSVHFYNVDDAIIDGFRIGFAGDCEGYSWSQNLRIDGGSGNTVQDCLFNGSTTQMNVSPIQVDSSANLTIANCEMNLTDTIFYYGIWAESSPNLEIHNNRFIDITQTSSGSSVFIYCILLDGCSGAVIKNNLIAEVDVLLSSGSVEGLLIKNCSNGEIINNTVCYLSAINGFITTASGYDLENCSNMTFYNNIASYIDGEDPCSGGGPPMRIDNGVKASYVAVTCDYTLAYDACHKFAGVAVKGVGCYENSSPQFVDPAAGNYDVQSGSDAQNGDPSFDDWDDTSGDGSRMGCHGGPGGEIVGLLTPE